MNPPSARASVRSLSIYPLAALQSLIVSQPKDFMDFLLYTLVSPLFGVGYAMIGVAVQDARRPGQDQ